MSKELAAVAKALVAPGKGLLAMDESNRTCNKRFEDVAFLSGGQSCALASAHLNAMNAKYGSRLPWPLTFSYARAIQQPALQLWQVLPANVKVAQHALLYRAKCNRAAIEGKYSEEMEMGEPAVVASNGLHTHLSSQD
jgi:fructose-bisphosphate aldolase class 1